MTKTTLWVDIECGMKPEELFTVYCNSSGKSVMNSYVQDWMDVNVRPPRITHGTTVQRNKFRCWAKVTNGHWGLEKEINEWCEENFGPLDVPGYRNPRWTNKLSYGVWHFKHDEDLTLFLLRWKQ